MPRTRSQLKMKPASEMNRSQYVEMFEETPLFAIIRLIGFQLAGIQVYLTFNAMGSPQYPPGASVCCLIFTLRCGIHPYPFSIGSHLPRYSKK